MDRDLTPLYTVLRRISVWTDRLDFLVAVGIGGALPGPAHTLAEREQRLDAGRAIASRLDFAAKADLLVTLARWRLDDGELSRLQRLMQRSVDTHRMSAHLVREMTLDLTDAGTSVHRLRPVVPPFGGDLEKRNVEKVDIDALSLCRSIENFLQEHGFWLVDEKAGCVTAGRYPPNESLDAVASDSSFSVRTRS